LGFGLQVSGFRAYIWIMLGLTPSELGIVVFIFLLVVAAARLPAWGEMLGEYFHRRREPGPQSPKN
jgi:hypothetical protein